jgi:hypothetical protein
MDDRRPPPIGPLRPKTPAPHTVPASVPERRHGPPAPLSQQQKEDLARMRQRSARMQAEWEISKAIAATLIGLTESEVVVAVQEAKRVLRIAQGGVTLDFMPARVTVWFEDGVVIRAKGG